MTIVMGRVVVHPEDAAAFAALARRLASATRSEAACLAYAFSQDLENPGVFWLSERWISGSGLDAHFLTGHIADFREGCAVLRIQSFHASRYDEVGDGVVLVSREAQVSREIDEDR